MNDNSRTLLIIAKTNWDGAHCYLSYDPIGRRIIRPVTFDPGDSLANARAKSLECETPLEIGLWYKFSLKQSLLLSETDAVSLLPHKNNDKFVESKIVRVDRPEIPWMQKNFDIMYETQNRSSLYTFLQQLAKTSMDEIFHPTKLIDCKYVNKGTDCPSVGVLQCFLGQLGASPAVSKDRKPKIEIHDEISNTTYRFPFTAQNADGFANFINSYNRPEEPVLLLFSTGRPWTGYKADEPYDPPRCYVLCVGLIRKYLPRSFNSGGGLQPLQNNGYSGYSEDSEFHPGLLEPMPLQCRGYGAYGVDYNRGLLPPLSRGGYPDEFNPGLLPPLPLGGYPDFNFDISQAGGYSGEFNPCALPPLQMGGYPQDCNPGILQPLPQGGFEYDVEEFYPGSQLPRKMHPRRKRKGSKQFKIPTANPVSNALQEFRRFPRQRTKSMHNHKFKRDYLSHNFYPGMSMQENRPGPYMPTFRHHERSNSMPELHPYQRNMQKLHEQQFLHDRQSGQFSGTQPFYNYEG